MKVAEFVQEIVEELVTIFERYDLVAVQEIKDIDEEVPYQFLDELNNNSSIEWKLVLSPRTGLQVDDQNSQEQYAYYYRSDVFSSLGNGTLYDDSINDSFQREPLVSQFQLMDLNQLLKCNLLILLVQKDCFFISIVK